MPYPSLPSSPSPFQREKREPERGSGTSEEHEDRTATWSQCSSPSVAVLSCPRQAKWAPPPSPYSLIQESIYEDPWRVLVACMLLNRTSGRQVRTVVWTLLEAFPTPWVLAQAPVARVEGIVRVLGIYK